MSEHPSRFDLRTFGGDYDEADATKFQTNLDKILNFLISHSGQWFTKEEIRIGAALPTGTDPTPRIRDLRKSKFGGWTVEQKKIDKYYRYRLTGRTPQTDEDIPF